MGGKHFLLVLSRDGLVRLLRRRFCQLLLQGNLYEVQGLHVSKDYKSVCFGGIFRTT